MSSKSAAPAKNNDVGPVPLEWQRGFKSLFVQRCFSLGSRLAWVF